MNYEESERFIEKNSGELGMLSAVQQDRVAKIFNLNPKATFWVMPDSLDHLGVF